MGIQADSGWESLSFAVGGGWSVLFVFAVLELVRFFLSRMDVGVWGESGVFGVGVVGQGTSASSVDGGWWLGGWAVWWRL